MRGKEKLSERYSFIGEQVTKKLWELIEAESNSSPDFRTRT
jgi:hypothetical protein